MEVTYELTPNDFRRYNFYYRHHKTSIRPVFLYIMAAFMGIIFMGGIWVIADSWLKYHQPQWAMLFYLAGMAFFISRFLPPTRKRMVKLAMQKPGLLCEHTIAISPTWLFEKTAVNETKVAWKTLQSIEEDTDYQYLFITKANAFIVPKCAFSSLAEAQAFLDKSRQYWEAAKTGHTAPDNDTRTWPPPPQSVK